VEYPKKGLAAKSYCGPLKPKLSQSHLNNAQEKVKAKRFSEVRTRSPFAYDMTELIETD
jgi:hypothetical protein